MTENLTAPSRVTAAYRSFVPSTTTSVTSFVWTAALLVCLLAFVTPVLALATDLSALGLVLAAGVGYALVLLVTRTGFEGLCSAVCVLATFDIGVTFLTGPGPIPVSSLSLMAVDVAAIPLALVLCYHVGAQASARRSPLSLRRPRWTLGTVAAALLCLFVCWTVLSGVVANGVSDLGPLLDAVGYVRYGLLFVLAALVVRQTNPWCVIYPLVIAIGGHLTVAVAQVINGGGFGLGTLGETPTVILGTFDLFGRVIPFGSYAGGFVGHSRELTMILLLFVPLVLAITARGSWRRQVAVLPVLGAAALVVRTADTDAGTAAFGLAGLLLIATFGSAALRDRHPRFARTVLASGIAGALAASALTVWVATRALAGSAPTIPLFDTRTLGIRIEQYRVAIDIAGTYPLFGLGSGNFYLMAETFGFAHLRGLHGVVFSYLATLGVVAAGTYVLGVVAVLALAFRRFYRTQDRDRYLWGALVCGMIGFHAYSLWDLAHLWDAALSILWLLIGVVIGAGSSRSKNGSVARHR